MELFNCRAVNDLFQQQNFIQDYEILVDDLTEVSEIRSNVQVPDATYCILEPTFITT